MIRTVYNHCCHNIKLNCLFLNALISTTSFFKRCFPNLPLFSGNNQKYFLSKLTGFYTGIILVLLFSTSSYALLSTQSAIVVEGTKPFMKINGIEVTNLDELLSFEMPDGKGGVVTITPTTASVIEVDPNYTLDQFATRVIANGTSKDLSTLPNVVYDDIDGDIPQADHPITGTLTATWSYQLPNGTQRKLSESELAGHFDACNSPYTLTISASKVKVKSGYGLPIDNNFTDGSKSYTFDVSERKVCFVKPNQMVIYPSINWFGWNGTSWERNNGYTNPAASGGYGGGYSADFDADRGFSASAVPAFPTTAFERASFILVMSGKPSDYTYSSSQPKAISINSKGEILFLSKPSGTVTIKAQPKVASGAKLSALTYELW